MKLARIGQVPLSGLPVGQWRYLTLHEQFRTTRKTRRKAHTAPAVIVRYRKIANGHMKPRQMPEPISANPPRQRVSDTGSQASKQTLGPSSQQRLGRGGWMLVLSASPCVRRSQSTSRGSAQRVTPCGHRDGGPEQLRDWLTAPTQLARNLGQQVAEMNDTTNTVLRPNSGRASSPIRCWIRLA
jgi:hypothetical protein